MMLLNIVIGLAAGWVLAQAGIWLLVRRGLAPDATEPSAANNAEGLATQARVRFPVRGRLAANSAAAFGTAALFALMYMRFGLSGAWVIGLLLSALSVLISFTDLTARVIPNGALLVFASTLLTAVLLWSDRPLLNHALGALVGGGFLLLLAVVTSGRGMGMGDVKLLALLGWVIGFPGVIIALFLASLTGAVAGLLLKVARREEGRQTIAFGPFLAFGTLVVYMYGEEIIHWYLSNVVHL
ncbi:prepilin peptidase [Fontibacillus sp. BL9]|uniref:prepilin peptidase n=1 Tax=Fontibacillus sp. BL9 TaxID=3389971 RepID=UPI0039780E01